MREPIFIVGANRSGTTLLRLMLNAHPRIAIPEEMVYVNARIGGVRLARWRKPGWGREAYGAFVGRFIEETCRHLAGVDREALRQRLLAEGPTSLRRPYALALEAFASAHGKARWGEKTPGNLFYADVLADMFPGARFVHVVRDPRAAVASMRRAPFFTDDVAFCAMNWRKHLTRGRATLKGAVAEDARLVVRYEDLVADPEQVLRSLCAFLGERYDPAMLAFHADSARFMKPEAASGFNAAATRPVSAAAVGKWRRQLARREVSLVEAVCGREMERLGYSREGGRLAAADVVALAAKRAYWNAQNWRNRHAPHYTLQHAMFARPRGRFRTAWHLLSGRARVATP